MTAGHKKNIILKNITRTLTYSNGYDPFLVRVSNPAKPERGISVTLTPILPYNHHKVQKKNIYFVLNVNINAYLMINTRFTGLSH